MSDNWIETITYYYFLGGDHVLLYVTIEGIRYRLINVTDEGEVLLMDMNNNLQIADYDEVYESRKQFFFVDTPLEKHIELLPESIKVSGKNEVIVYDK